MDEEEYLDDDLLQLRGRRRVRRWVWALLWAAILVPVVVAYYWFAQIVHPSPAVDLWLVVAPASEAGDGVLVDASVRDPQDGERLADVDYVFEVYEDGVLSEREVLQGDARREVTGRAGVREIRVRLSEADARIGEVAVEQAIVVGAARAEVSSARGGLITSPGRPGLALVREDAACDVRLRALASGGVPMGTMENEILLEARRSSGAPAAGLAIVVGESTSPVTPARVVTDGRGYARVRVTPADRDYLEFRALCAGGASLFGFELQPIWEGITVGRLRSEPGEGVAAEVRSGRRMGELWWELVCSSELVSWGSLSSAGGDVWVPRERLSGVEDGARCQLVAYRDPFAMARGWATRAFSLGRATDSDEWSLSASGLGVSRPVAARSQADGQVRLDAWGAHQRSLLQWSLSLLWLFYMAAWYVALRRGLTVGRGGAVQVDAVAPTPFGGRRGPLLSGWVVISVFVAGVWYMMRLMGL